MSHSPNILFFLIAAPAILLVGCGHKETIPDPMQTVSSFLKDLEFRGVAAASSYFVPTPRTAWKDFPRLTGNVTDDFKSWQVVSDADEFVEYHGLPAEYLPDFLIKAPKGGIMTRDQFKKIFDKFSFTDCQVSTTDYVKQSEGKELEVYGYASMGVETGGFTIPVGRRYMMIRLRYGNKGWKVTGFSPYDESMKRLF